MKLVIASYFPAQLSSAGGARGDAQRTHSERNRLTGVDRADKQQGESCSISPPVKRMPMGGLIAYPQAENMEPGVYKVTFKNR